MSKEWNFYKTDFDEVKKIQENYSLNKLLAIVLANRKIENIEKYLNPTRRDFYDPFEMPDMKKAVDRILKAMDNGEKIIIYGDYDVDGITSITVLKSFLHDLGTEVGQYIPNRLNEGYGLNKDAIKEIAKDEYELIITVDCGITAIDEIEYANELGIDVIITDHHEPGENIPNAIAVVDCKRKDNKYPFRELAGVGVAFKVCQAIGITLKLPEKEYLKYLDIVAIGTISDIVPLVDENRVITKLGMLLVNCTKNYGLKSLLSSSGYTKVDSNCISFGVAPKINACGRMGFAYEGLDLLLSKNMEDANKKSSNIIKYNTDRQNFEKIIYNEAIEQIEKNNLQNANSIVLGGKNWHNGVIGIVASKITDLYYKPCLLISFDEDSDIGKGSGRSIPEFDLHEALMECQDILESFGGHSMAVGLSVKKDNLHLLQEKFEELANKGKIKNKRPALNIESSINIDEITKEMVESLDMLEPIGEGNKTPVWAFKNLKINSIRTLSEGKHLKVTLSSGSNTLIDGIGFGLGDLSEDFVIGDKVDVVGTLEVNSFNGMESLQINLKDIIHKIY